MQKSLFDGQEDQKRCCRCKEWKDRDQFVKDKEKKDGLRYDCKECKRGQDRAYNQTPPGKFRHCKDGARSRGYDFELTPEQFTSLIVDRTCTYCDEPSRGIDRVVNEIGYLIDNCVPCCGVCNIMKRHHSKEYFFEQVERVYTHSVKPRKMNTNGTI